MNFSLGVTMSNNGGMVIRNGNQVIKIGSNGVTVSGGGQNVRMNGMGISINQNGQQIRMDDRGIYVKGPRGGTMYNGPRQFQQYDYYEDSFRGDEEDEYQESYAYDDDENIEDDDEFSEDSFEEIDSQYGFRYDQEDFEEVFPQHFVFPQARQYFEHVHGVFQEEEKQEEEPKPTQKQIDKLPLSVYKEEKPVIKEEKPAPKPRKFFFSKKREPVVDPKAKTSTKPTTKLPEKTQPQKTTAQPTSSEVCAVCIVDYKKGDLQRKLPCNHKFHKDCIDKWLLIKNNCPVCKTKPIDI